MLVAVYTLFLRASDAPTLLFSLASHVRPGRADGTGAKPGSGYTAHRCLVWITLLHMIHHGWRLTSLFDRLSSLQPNWRIVPKTFLKPVKNRRHDDQKKSVQKEH